MNAVKIFQNTGFKETNGYLIYNEDDKNAVLIDTAMGMADEINAFLQEHNLKLDAIFITHSHFDHIVGLNEIYDANPGVTVYVTMAELPGLFDSTYNLSNLYNTKYGTFHWKPLNRIRAVRDGEVFQFGAIEFKVLFEGGHTSGSIMIDFFHEHWLFSGGIIQGDRVDTAIAGLGYNPRQIEKNIRWVLQDLPTDYLLYPCHHMSPMKVGDIIKYNPRLQRILALGRHDDEE